MMRRLPGEMPREPMRGQLLRLLAPALCLITAIAALSVAALLDGRGETGGSGAGAVEVSGGSPTAGGGEGEGMDGLDESTPSLAESQVDGLFRLLGSGDDVSDSQSADVVSAGTFLNELEARATEAEPGAGEVSVIWRDESGLVPAGSDVLMEYRQVPTSRLRASGYLDLKGNAWGAIVQDDRGWVDIVVVHASDEGAAIVRVARVLAEVRD